MVKVLAKKREQNGLPACCLLMDMGLLPRNLPCF